MSDLEKFKEACEINEIKPSQKLRLLMMDFLDAQKGDSGNIQNVVLNNLKNSVNSALSLSIGEMYCGPGGIGRAAADALVSYKGQSYIFSHSWATDYHKDTCRTYEQNIFGSSDSGKVICNDIRDVDLEALESVDGFLYGFPCNDFSNVGESKGLQGEFGPLYSYGVKYINIHNPKFILAENVSGISNANSGFAFAKILKELSEAGDFGYNLTVHLYKFEDYGIPQARHRIIIVGFRKDLDMKFNVPAPSLKMLTARDALEVPPIPQDAENQEITKQSKTVVERLKHIKPGENAWTASLPEHLKLNVKGAKMSMIYKRLNPDKPSYTVTGSGGGGTHVYHWDEPRALTNRERARLQTFPDDFKFYGSKESVRRQIGMAVPVKGAQIILESILMTFARKPYVSVKPNLDIDKIVSELKT